MAGLNMRFLKDISLQRKQTFILMLVSGTVLFLACLMFISYDVFTFRRAMVHTLSILTEIIGKNSSVSLESDDAESTEEILSALSAAPNIEAACIYKSDGSIFATYDRPDAKTKTFPLMMQEDGSYFEGRTFHAFKKITRGSEVIGTVYLECNLRILFQRSMGFLLIGGVVFVIASLVALFLASRLQKFVSGPILHLVQMTRAVAEGKNYSMRATKQGGDELGMLVDNFNEMLSQIELRDHELLTARGVLEQRVKDRTRELESEVSERQRSEDALRKTNERFEIVMQSTADVIWDWDLKTNALWWNENFQKVFGYTASEIGKDADSWGSRIHPDDAADVLKSIHDTIDGSEHSWSGEYRFRRQDGCYAYIYDRGYVLRDDDGTPFRMIGAMQDLTERKNAEAALRRTEELYRRAIGGAGAVPYLSHYKTKSYAFMGEGIEELIGYPAHEVTGELWKQIIQESQMLGEASGLDKYEASERVLANQIRTWCCDMRVITKDGRSRWLSDTSVQKLDQSGNAVGSMGILQDITERKEAEEALRERDAKFNQLADNITDVFWIRSPDLKELHYVSPALEQIWGFRPESLHSNPGRWVDAILPEDRGRVLAVFSTLTADAPSIDLEYRIIRPDGAIRWVHVRGFQVRDAAGKLVRLTGIASDFTERKQAGITAAVFSCLGQNLSAAASPQEAAEIISRVSEDLIGWDAFSIQLYSEKGDLISSIFEADTVDGKRIHTEVPNPRIPTELHRRIFKYGAELVFRENVESDLPDVLAFGNKASPSQSIMYVPIRSRSRPVGILSVHSYTPKAYDTHDLNTLQTLADQCGGALERMRTDEELRKSESQFRLVWNSSADGMRLANSEGITLMVNDVYCQMVRKTRSELEGQPLSIVHSRESAGRISQRHKEQIDSRAAQSHWEKEVTLWDGRKIWFELSNSLLDLPGQPSLLLTIFRDITLRKKAETELAILHHQLLDTSRQAGMAEVATSVLHNVGNVLNSVNVSGSIIRERIKKSKAANLSKVVKILDEHAADLPGFFASDPRSKHVPAYLSELAANVAREQEEVLGEVASLVNNIEHIKEIVTMQQSYAKVSGVSEVLQITDLVEDAFRMNEGGMQEKQVQVFRDYATLPPILVEKHKVLQILVNLMRNAKHAMDENGSRAKELRLRVYLKTENVVCISVQDSGTGIEPQNLTRIFSHGFTTRKDGHGFGLHSGALTAKELGGALTVHSDGHGMGAVFTLELPLTVEEKRT